VNEAQWRERFAAARVAVLGPRLVPVCFAVNDDCTVAWSAVDDKPKRTRDLARLADVRAHPFATLLVQHWDEDWSQLWWVRVSGPARVLDGHEEGVHRLRAKYVQYATHALDGPVLEVELRDWRTWAAGQ
jgi:PPOX class probable F420-dependent enzyme